MLILMVFLSPMMLVLLDIQAISLALMVVLVLLVATLVLVNFEALCNKLEAGGEEEEVDELMEEVAIREGYLG